MGNLESAFKKVCGSALKKKPKVIPLFLSIFLSHKIIYLILLKKQEEENSYFLARNQDKYFQKDDYDRIMIKFADSYRDWMLQSTTPFKDSKPKHKRIR